MAEPTAPQFWPPMSASEQRMKTAVSPVRMVRARWRWTGSLTISSRCSVIATKTSPVRAAAPPPTTMK